MPARTVHALPRGIFGRMAMLLALVLLALALCAPRGAGAQAPQPKPAATNEAVIDAQARRLAAELRCPVCQGLSLADSPAELSQEMKDVIRAQLVDGRTPEEVKAYFVGRYGEWILLQPPARGLNLLVYVLPIAVVMTGLGGVVVLARRWTRAGATAPAGADTATE
jgi:cytochrome c-type biogenesis protein CcmH